MIYCYYLSLILLAKSSSSHSHAPTSYYQPTTKQAGQAGSKPPNSSHTTNKAHPSPPNDDPDTSSDEEEHDAPTNKAHKPPSNNDTDTSSDEEEEFATAPHPTNLKKATPTADKDSSPAHHHPTAKTGAPTTKAPPNKTTPVAPTTKAPPNKTTPVAAATFASSSDEDSVLGAAHGNTDFTDSPSPEKQPTATVDRFFQVALMGQENVAPTSPDEHTAPTPPNRNDVTPAHQLPATKTIAVPLSDTANRARTNKRTKKAQATLPTQKKIPAKKKNLTKKKATPIIALRDIHPAKPKIGCSLCDVTMINLVMLEARFVKQYLSLKAKGDNTLTKHIPTSSCLGQCGTTGSSLKIGIHYCRGCEDVLADNIAKNVKPGRNLSWYCAPCHLSSMTQDEEAGGGTRVSKRGRKPKVIM